MHLHHDMVVCQETYAKQVLGIRASDRVYSAAKLFFAYGLGNAGYFPMGVGAQSILYPHRPTPDSVFELLEPSSATLFFGVPTLYAAMLAAKDAEQRYDLSSLRLCVSAGEALPDELYKRWRERFGVEIIDGIGTTEILPHLHLEPSGRHAARRDRPAGAGLRGDRGGRRRRVPCPGRDRQPARQGRLDHGRTTGTSTRRPRRRSSGRWIQTGDKYYQDADGYFWYAGRADDMLKVGGIWVSPVEVEATLIKHPAVLEAAVVGREDADRLVKPQAFVVLKDPAAAATGLADELKAFVKDKIAPYKYPRWIEFVTELPKTADRQDPALQAADLKLRVRPHR